MTEDASERSAPQRRPSVAAPSSISDAARTYLTARIAAAREPSLGPASETPEAWQAYIDEASEGMQRLYAVNDNLAVVHQQRDVDGVTTFVLTPADRPEGPVYLDVHGGGFALGGGDVARLTGMAAAERTGLTTWSPDYRLPPRHPFPAGLDDLVAVYRRLLEEHPAGQVIVGGGAAGGGSAGGNLACALMLRALQEDLPLPAGLMLFSPLVDMSEAGDTWRTNLGIDHAIGASLQRRTRLYAGGADPTQPLLSPLTSRDLAHFPPTLLVGGTRDLLLSDTVRFHRALRNAGVDAALHVWEAMSHGGFGGSTPEDGEVTTEIRRFASRVLAT